MINWSCKYITLVVSLFLTSFVGAFAVNAICDMQNIKSKVSVVHSHYRLNYATSSNHNHISYEKIRDSSNQHHQHTGHVNSSTEGECCDGASNILELSLFSGFSKVEIPTIKIIDNGTEDAIYYNTSLYYIINTIFHEYDVPPPLSGFTLRVVIESFLN